MTIFDKKLKQAFSGSMYDLCMKHQKTDIRYQNLKKEYDRLFDKIRILLGKKHRKLMLKLEALGNDRSIIDHDLIYLQGMIDCVKLLKLIKMI